VSPVAPATAVSATWCIRFLNGPLRGRTIALKHGANVVGSGADCDILLQGDVLPRHLVFTVGDIAVSIKKLGTAIVKLNGEELSLQRRSVVRGDIISVGQVDFELGKVSLDASVPDIPWENRAGNELDEPDAVTSNVEAEPTDSRKSALPLKPALIAALGVLAITLVFWVGLSDKPSGSDRVWNAASDQPDFETLHRVIAQHPELKVVDRPNGQLSVRGFVASRARRAALMESLRGFGDGVSVNIHAADEIVEQAYRYLGEPGLSIDYAGQGRLIVTGVTKNNAVHQKVARLAEDLRSVVAVIDEVEAENPQARSAQQRSSEFTKWENSLPAQMVGLTEFTNGMRHIQLANGVRYYEGATLESGEELVNIEADHLVVTKSKKEDVVDAQANPLAQ